MFPEVRVREAVQLGSQRLDYKYELQTIPNVYHNTIDLSTMLPETMQAIKIVSPGKAEIQDVPLPKLPDHFILVKVRAVAINPTDWSETSSPLTSE